MEQGGHLVRMAIIFPAHYPNGAAPSFTLDSKTTIDISSQQELIRVTLHTPTHYELPPHVVIVVNTRAYTPMFII